MKRLTVAMIALCLAGSLCAMPFDNRVTLPGGQKLFVAGFNLAWINFGNDVGDSPLETARFRKAFSDISKVGGNTVRVWLSTNGSHDPRFGPDGLVDGLGSKTIDNVKTMLILAKRNNLKLDLVLLTHNFMQAGQGGDLKNNRRLLTTDEGLQAYIDKALVPLVSAIGLDPNLLCWEIANEPEGMDQNGGWTSARISQRDIQRFTNRMAGAIKRAVPGVLVSTGAVTANKLPWYTDAALIQAGGDKDGTLDFYMIHYYGWNGASNSPFTKDAKAWGVDKPLVVGEFPSSSWDSSTTKASNRLYDSGNIDDLMENLWTRGYAGGMYWQYQGDGGDPWLKGYETAAPALQKFSQTHDLTQQ